MPRVDVERASHSSWSTHWATQRRVTRSPIVPMNWPDAISHSRAIGMTTLNEAGFCRFGLPVALETIGTSSFKGEHEHAMDNFCSFACPVVLRAGHIVHVWRVCSHLASHRGGCAGVPTDFWAPNRLINPRAR